MMLSPETQTELLMGAAASVDKHLKTGKCKAFYLHGDVKGGFGIWEVDSALDGGMIANENPMNPWQNTEIMPILDWDESKKILEKRKRAASKKDYSKTPRQI